MYHHQFRSIYYIVINSEEEEEAGSIVSRMETAFTTYNKDDLAWQTPDDFKREI